MEHLQIQSNPAVEDVFERYPEPVRKKVEYLRDLILTTANDIESITKLEETLKWGEPSYLAKKGSTIRIDWKTKTPDQYAVYFKCTSKLVPTFKMFFKDTFTFEGNRAIVFKMDEAIPDKELIKCIATALTYHKVKELPLLGLG